MDRLAAATSHAAGQVIDRREPLRRAAALLGRALSSSLARCVPAGTWRPRALTSDQAELVATIAEHILLQIDTPGARAVGHAVGEVTRGNL